MAREVPEPMKRPKEVRDEDIRAELKKLGLKFPDHLSTEELVEVYKDYKAVKNLLPDEVWANYNLLGVRDLREQIMLRAAKNALKKRMYELKKAYAKERRENAKKEKSEHKATKKSAK